MLEFGIQFFPDVGPAQKAADVYFDECLRLVDLCDPLGLTSVRIVEHYFEPYGGYSPNPHIFLTAAAQRSRQARLITGAVLPVFNHPFKVAGEIAMLDAISHGRIEAGFARAFLPHEFHRFGVSMDESRARFEEGVAAVRVLLEEEKASFSGRFHSFSDVTSLPRPTQKPRPPFWVAALATPQSFVDAGTNGYAVMAIPMAGGKMKELIGLYRDAWRSAGHPGEGRIMLAFHMFCASDRGEVAVAARDRLNAYLKSLVAAAALDGGWMSGQSSKDYANYDKIIAALDQETYESQIEKGAAWIGTPAEIRDQIHAFVDMVGPFEIASLQVNFNTMPYDLAARSLKLFAEQVMPHFRG